MRYYKELLRMNNIDVAIVVVSFDKYSDIWDTFTLCLNRFWMERSYKTYLITNELSPIYPGIEVISTGVETTWSERVLKALDIIKEKYVIILLEDYLLDEKIDNGLVEKTLNYVENNGIEYFRLVPIPKTKGHADSFHVISIENQSLYGVNLQAAIWKKEYLKEIVSKGAFSAWEFEARQKQGAVTRIKGKCVASQKYIIHYANGIIQGKWYSKTINELKQKGIDIPLGKRGMMNDKDMKREVFRNFLLHHIHPSIIRLTKPLAKKLGFKFVTD